MIANLFLIDAATGSGCLFGCSDFVRLRDRIRRKEARTKRCFETDESANNRENSNRKGFESLRTGFDVPSGLSQVLEYRVLFEVTRKCSFFQFQNTSNCLCRSMCLDRIAFLVIDLKTLD